MKKKNNVAILGPKGTFTETAARKLFGEAELTHCDTVEEVFDSVDNGADYGVVAIENSLEGSVNTTMDCLMEYDVNIFKEAVLDIHLCLMAAPKTTPGDIRTIISHPHALPQCKKFLKKNFPQAKARAHESTAAAMKEIKERSLRDTAAVGPRESAAIYGLEVLFENIEDAPSQTRFLAVSKKPGIGDKTSIIFALKDRPGALSAALKDFADRGINLTRIESRPSKRKLGEYSFYVDFAGSLQEPKVKEVLSSLKEKTSFIKVLGSY
jgi:prephenate dehydratase